MNIKDLQPVSKLAMQSGVKALVYGPPGSGKTPISQTAPRPVLCAIEPGLLSLRSVPNLLTWEANTVEKIYEFFNWVFESNEIKNFDTIVIDSVSQLANLILEQELIKNKHGKQAYGEMAKKVLVIMNKIYYFQIVQCSFATLGVPRTKILFSSHVIIEKTLYITLSFIDNFFQIC